MTEVQQILMNRPFKAKLKLCDGFNEPGIIQLNTIEIMKAYQPPIVHELIVDGVALNTTMPFSVYESFPRNDSMKSTASTHMGARQDYQLPEIVHGLRLINQSLRQAKGLDYQETYEIMMRIRSVSELQDLQHSNGDVVQGRKRGFCAFRKSECAKNRKTLYLNQFQDFEYKGNH